VSDFLLSLLSDAAESAAQGVARRLTAAAQPPAQAKPASASPRGAPAKKPAAEAVAVVVAPVATPRQQPAATAGARGNLAARMFGSRQGLLQTLVASEVLGPPVALRRDNLWSERGV